MNKCFHCGNEDVELRTVSIDIAGEQIECLQCSESKSVILSKDDIMKINHRYGDAEEEIEELQNEVNNLRRAVDVPKEEPTDEDIDNYINSKI